MTVRLWWQSLSRAYQLVIVLLIVDTTLALGAAMRILPLQATWEVLSGYVPNTFEPIFFLLVSIIRDLAPGQAVASSVFLVSLAAYCSVLAVHLAVGIGIGFLFDSLPRTRMWSFATYGTLIGVLFVLHFFLILSKFAL